MIEAKKYSKTIKLRHFIINNFIEPINSAEFRTFSSKINHIIDKNYKILYNLIEKKEIIQNKDLYLTLESYKKLQSMIDIGLSISLVESFKMLAIIDLFNDKCNNCILKNKKIFSISDYLKFKVGDNNSP